MGTPIRHLLKSKILSPVSPFAKQNFLHTHGDSQFPTNVTRARQIARTLDFNVSPKNLALKTASTHATLKPENRDHVQIKVTDDSRESLLINTPNKNLLLRDGLSSTKSLNILGRGSFGTVVHGIYKGVDVAAKIVQLTKNNLASLKEANALNLSHENVIKIVEIIHGRNANYGIILMEYLRFSRHLQSILDDYSVDLNQKTIVKYALDICKGLEYCHENRVLHLDLKPSNILVCEDGLCKLCDFGNSAKVGEVGGWKVSHQCTVAYAAPEILMGKSPTFKCDVYSLGITLWQMRYRIIPYLELDGIEVIIYRVVKSAYRPSELSNSIKDKYHIIYSSCWAANPCDRPNIYFVMDELKNT